MGSLKHRSFFRDLVASRKTNPVWACARSIVSHLYDIPEDEINEKVEKGISALEKRRSQPPPPEHVECEVLDD